MSNGVYSTYSSLIVSNISDCQISYYPDFKWLVDKQSVGQQEGVLRNRQLVDGSSVAISAQPKIWTDLPPGAKDFLNSLVVVPK
jgi:hypothetical protein